MPALWAVALIFLASATAKLATPGSAQAAFDSLRVPRALNRPWLVKAFPVLEIALAAALFGPWPPVQVAAAAVATALMLVFLILVLGARKDGAACHCFGAASTRPVTTATMVRNVLFLLLALAALVEALVHVSRGVVVGQGLATGTKTDLLWYLVIATLMIGAAWVAGRESAPATPIGSTVQPHAAEPNADHPADDGEDVPRHPIPATAVHWNRQYHDLAVLAASQAMLVFRLSPGCGSCAGVIEQLRGWGPSLGPIALRIIAPVGAPEQGVHGFEGFPDEMIMRDPGGATVAALGLTGYPAAVLLGTDGLTAGGPALGYDEVMDLVTEVRELFDQPAPTPTPEGSTA